jgi:spore maturation protein CgeB
MSTPARVATAPERVLARNLAALDAVDPELAERVRLPVDCGSARVEPGGGLALRRHRAWIALDVDAGEVERLVASVGAARSALVVGAGAGELVHALLDHGNLPVTAWEHDPWLLRLLLGLRDVSEALASRRLSLALGTDLLELAEGEGVATLEHPVLAPLHAGELATWRARRADPARPCVALSAAGLFVEDVRHALEARGLSGWRLDLAGWSEDELAHALRRLAPELLLAIDGVDGLAEFCDRHGVPLVLWEVDPATTLPRPLARGGENAFVFTYRRAHVERWRAAGYGHAEYLPLAADTELRRPLELGAAERERLAAPLGLVGSSLVANARACRERLLAAWSEWQGGQLADRGALLDALLAEQRRDLGVFRVPELLEAAAPGFRAAALALPGAEDPVQLAGEVAACEKRMSWAANLAPSGLAVWGDAGWSALTRFGVSYRGPAGHREELTRVYNACDLCWDVGRLTQADIVTMRVFDVLACERLLLAERSDELAELFTSGVELETYGSLAELRSKVAHYASHPEEAAAIARRGRAAVEARHTVSHRVATMLERVS